MCQDGQGNPRYRRVDGQVPAPRDELNTGFQPQAAVEPVVDRQRHREAEGNPPEGRESSSGPVGFQDET
jgi:hypothetical protein